MSYLNLFNFRSHHRHKHHKKHPDSMRSKNNGDSKTPIEKQKSIKVAENDVSMNFALKIYFHSITSLLFAY